MRSHLEVLIIVIWTRLPGGPRCESPIPRRPQHVGDRRRSPADGPPQRRRRHHVRTLQHSGVSSSTDLFCDGDAGTVVRRRRLSIVAGAERLTTVTTWISDPKSALVEFAVGRAGAVRHYRGAAGHRPVGSVDDDPESAHAGLIEG